MLTSSKTYRYVSIANDLRRDIADNYNPGDFLNTESVLAQKFSANHQTIRQAMSLLVDEGLIRRNRGRGTVVTDRLLTGEFAIVVRPQLLGPEASAVYQKSVAAIMQRLQQENPRYKTRMHLGKMVEKAEDFSATLDLTEPKVLTSLRGVFTFHALPGLDQALAQAGVPIIKLGGRGGTHSVAWDWDLFYQQAISALHESGCRSVGLLWAHPQGVPVEESADRKFLNCVAQAGLTSTAKWMAKVEGEMSERNAYDCFTRFWQQPNHPDGLVVMDDILCRGALRAILKMGLEMPKHLRLITQANRGVDLPFHRPVTRVTFDSTELAAQAVDMMLTLTRKKKLTHAHVSVPGKLVVAKTT